MATTLILGKYAFETYINFRQYQVYNRENPPKTLEKEFTPSVFKKAQAYSRAKGKFSFFSDAVSVVRELIAIKYDFLPKLWSISACVASRLSETAVIGKIISTSVMSQSLVFFVFTTLLSVIEGLPLDYYKTFVLEQKWGFNKSTKKTWIVDNIKNVLLTVVLGTPFVYAFLRIISAYGTSFVKYATVLVIATQLILMTIFPTLIMPLFYKMTPLEDGELKSTIEELARENSFPLTHLYVIDGSTRSSHSNAMFVGLPWSKKILLFDTLIDHSTIPQIKAVLAHEIGHWKLSHLPKRMLASQLTVVYSFVLFSAFLHNKSLFQSFGFPPNAPSLIAFMLFSYISSATEPLLQTLNSLLSRTHEYEADKFAKDQGLKDDLATSLIQLATENLSSLDADWLYSTYCHSHPILADRLNALGYVSTEKVGNIKLDVEKEEDKQN